MGESAAPPAARHGPHRCGQEHRANEKMGRGPHSTEIFRGLINEVDRKDEVGG